MTQQVGNGKHHFIMDGKFLYWQDIFQRMRRCREKQKFFGLQQKSAFMELFSLRFIFAFCSLPKRKEDSSLFDSAFVIRLHSLITLNFRMGTCYIITSRARIRFNEPSASAKSQRSIIYEHPPLHNYNDKICKNFPINFT